MKTVPLPEARGLVLNWLVARSLGIDVVIKSAQERRDFMLQTVSTMDSKPERESLRAALKSLPPELKVFSSQYGMQPLPNYCQDRSTSAEVAENHQIGLIPKSDGTWRAYCLTSEGVYAGETPALASMRCKAGATFGLNPEVPDDLVEWEVSDAEIDKLVEDCLSDRNEPRERLSCS